MEVEVRLVSTASGSSGNCIYVGPDNTHILVDADISNKRIEQGLSETDIKDGGLDGIVIAHEHSDHTKELGVPARKRGVPIYSTRETLEEVRKIKYLGEHPEESLKPIHPNVDFMIDDVEVRPFHIGHNAVNPVAYRIQCGRESVAATTDMGHFDQHITNHLQGLNAILPESNHDVSVLEADPYPYYLKCRILGDRGHLSNENTGRLLNYVLHSNLKNILLGHLSKENNYEELACEVARLRIEQEDHGYRSADLSIAVAKQDFMLEIITI